MGREGEGMGWEGEGMERLLMRERRDHTFLVLEWVALDDGGDVVLRCMQNGLWMLID